MKHKFVLGVMGFLLMLTQGCVSVNSFPRIARAGDTVSVMIGGSEIVRKETVDVSLTDAAGQTWNLRSLGLVRSVFNLRTAGTANGLHYSPYLDIYYPWSHGHEPLQTVLVTDIPANASPGNATLSIAINAADDSSAIASPFSVKLEIIPGAGSADNFLRKNGFGSSEPVDFGKLESSPYAKITFGSGAMIGAASLRVNFNNSVLNGNDINVYSPESTVRGSFSSTGAFGDNQRMIYWRQDGSNLYVDVVAPRGIDGKFLQLYVVHPRGLSANPNLTLTSAAVYDVSGAPVAVQPALQYFP